MTSKALMCTYPIAQVIRVSTADGVRDLQSIAQAAAYLQDAFDRSFEGDVRWHAAAKALEEASDDSEMIPHATRALRHLLETENRIILPEQANAPRKVALTASELASQFAAKFGLHPGRFQIAPSTQMGWIVTVQQQADRPGLVEQAQQLARTLRTLYDLKQ